MLNSLSAGKLQLLPIFAASRPESDDVTSDMTLRQWFTFSTIAGRRDDRGKAV